VTLYNPDQENPVIFSRWVVHRFDVINILKKILIIYFHNINNYMNSFIQHYNLILESFKDAQIKWSVNNDQTEVKDYIDLYKKLKQNKGIFRQVSSTYNFNIEDISQWINKDFNEFKAFIDNIKSFKSKSQVTKDVKLSGADKVFENEYVTIVTPKTHKASCYYGSGTKWCTTAKSSDYWDEYNNDGVKFYYILHKQLPSNNDMYKVAIASFKSIYGFNMESYDAANTLIKDGKLNAFLKIYNIPKNIFMNEWNKDEWLANVDHIVNEDNSIDVNGDVHLVDIGLTEMPFRFNKVSGDFYCSINKLTSLVGGPKIVGGHFSCSGNKLTTLIGAPQEVGKSFICNYNKLTSIVGSPQLIHSDFNCAHNQLTTLKHAPHTVVGGFYCDHNRLTTLKYAPRKVLGDFYCGNNPIISLEGKPENIGGYFVP